VRAGAKFVPSIRTKVKPNAGPLSGVTFVTVGPAETAEIMIARLFVAVCAGEDESVTVTVKVELPAVVGVPVMAPVEAARLSPAGSDPVVTAQL
jgi:hypothetical protein